MRERVVGRIFKSADGGTCLLSKNNNTKPTAWREGVQILKEEEGNAKQLVRCEETRKEWARHWHCDTEVQDVKDKPRRHEELQNRDEEGIC